MRIFEKLPDAVLLRAHYADAIPFPHISLINLIPEPLLRDMVTEWPPPESPLWRHNLKPTGDKWGANEPALYGPTLRAVVEEMNGPEFVAWLSKLSGIPGLVPDDRPVLGGAGLHEMRAGGFLELHVDFNRMHKKIGPHRRLNVFLFLNEGWRVEDGGALELWGSPDRNAPRRILEPTLGRLVIFSTSESSWHGNPNPVRRTDATRKSIALYYYSEEPPPGWPGESHGTIYRGAKP